jgi:LPPG:FO 2-phospho-L-lactate transferase
LTVIGNVRDDETIYGLAVSPDLDTLVYTLAGIEGPAGWGIADDTFAVMDHLDALGVPTSFRLGDRDMATCLLRTEMLASGGSLSAATEKIARSFGVATPVLPASDDPVRTTITTTSGERLAFQEYFVTRGHRDEVAGVAYDGAEDARPAPCVIDAISAASLVVIAPSNPPLSLPPTLAVPGIREAIAAKDRVVAISPLFGGRALKGPADRVLASLGFPPGNAGVLASYDGLVTDLVIDDGDASDADALAGPVRVHVTRTLLGAPADARRFGTWFAETFS